MQFYGLAKQIPLERVKPDWQAVQGCDLSLQLNVPIQLPLFSVSSEEHLAQRVELMFWIHPDRSRLQLLLMSS